MKVHHSTIVILVIAYINCYSKMVYAIPAVIIDAHLGDSGNVYESQQLITSGEEKGKSEEFIFTNKKSLNLRPIIGILSQELSEGMKRNRGLKKYNSYIAASYVKFLESAGARVVPVLINQDDWYYVNLTKYLNGFLFPGGAIAINSSSGYGRAGKRIFDLVSTVEESDAPIPLWGTCLGFEMLLYLVAGKNPLTPCNAMNKADSLKFRPGYEDSKLFGPISSNILKSLASLNITSNFHQECITPEVFGKLHLDESMTILSTNKDYEGVEYISTVEHKTKPFFGTQWHPEKAAFEWADDDNHKSIPHSVEAIRASQAMAEIFVENARNNTNHFPTEKMAKENLIYNYSPKYVAQLYGSSFQLCYFFK